MSTHNQHKRTDMAVIINIGIGIIIIVWLLKSCGGQQIRRDVEMKGLGMLEAKGFHDPLPSYAGTDYYNLIQDGSTQSEDIREFFARLKSYKYGRSALRKRGLSNKQIDKVPELELIKGAQSGSDYLDKLARQYK